jgi:hypothetical protein
LIRRPIGGYNPLNLNVKTGSVVPYLLALVAVVVGVDVLFPSGTGSGCG